LNRASAAGNLPEVLLWIDLPAKIPAAHFRKTAQFSVSNSFDFRHDTFSRTPIQSARQEL